MADIELVIKITEEDYERVKKKFQMSMNIMANAIAHGTPLPKGHGRLIDADAFKRNVCTYQQTGCGDCKYTLCCPEDAPTIIEADKGYEVEVITRGNCMMCGKELVDGLFFCKECENKANSRK